MNRIERIKVRLLGGAVKRAAPCAFFGNAFDYPGS